MAIADSRQSDVRGYEARLVMGRGLPSVVTAVVSLLVTAGCHRNRHSAGPVPPVPPRFADWTDRAKIHWRHVNGAGGRLYYPEQVGGGGGLIDFDNDGWPDVLLVNSGALPGFRGDTGHHALYLNNRDGSFRDVTATSGIVGPKYGMGLAVGDFDGDGRPDVYVTGVDEGRLYRNLGDGRFQDVTSGPLFNRGHWGASATWVDVNHDGRPDLFIGNYVRWYPARDVPCNMSGVRTYCGPTSYDSDHCRLLLNQGNGSFVDASQQSGLDRIPAKALGVVTLDIDHDGHLDLAVACDLVPNILLRNRGDGTFEDIALERGFALSEEGLPRAGMGIDAQEETARQWSIWVGNLTDEGTAYFVESPEGAFKDRAPALGLTAATRDVLTFGLVAQDYDADGRVDLVLANGHVDLMAERTRHQSVYQTPRMFIGDPSNRLVDVTATAGPPFAAKYMGRGLATGDFDNDGRLDLLMVENNGAAHLWRNETPGAYHWLGLDCRSGSLGSVALGTRIEVTANQDTQVRWVRSDGSYLSANDPRQNFGLGAAVTAERIRVRWPDGRIDEHRNLSADRYWRLLPGRKPEAVNFSR